VTFNAAHKYLGLTTEVLRTEKAINEIAFHPLPNSFYEGGGLQRLRQRFDTAAMRSPEVDMDYFDYSSHSRSPSLSKPYSTESSSRVKLTGSPASMRSPMTATTSRQQVQAGDLHSTTGQPYDAFRPLSRTFSSLNTPRVPRPGLEPEPSEDFDLREEVMSCIAKSIGLLQPPLSGSDSVEASPAFTPSEASRASSNRFSSPFGSLSLLDMADDSSSVTGGSSVTYSGYMTGLDNEVEILFFPAGSTLVRAGERNTGLSPGVARCFWSQTSLAGLFYVIEGFLDILLPLEESSHRKAPEPKPDAWGSPSKKNVGKEASQKLLFTVKAGGIAGYLGACILSSFPRPH
jgi:lysophospholipid hydrolase